MAEPFWFLDKQRMRGMGTVGVIEIRHLSYLFVHQNHAVIQLLKERAYLHDAEVVDNEWYALSCWCFMYILSCIYRACFRVFRMQRLWRRRARARIEARVDAVLMSLHTRLGAASPLGQLGQDLLAMVLASPI